MTAPFGKSTGMGTDASWTNPLFDPGIDAEKDQVTDI
jgi:hypothetical protein